ncbi:1214_t:CDS:2 [Funneliformis mosseae]|uniref:1214_t:CDS:1 n=1 Tax=Funneliformis mosseae TaxID=27381 RepID=A0A9N8ZQH9_FUNMO|nr:1214_t:CDS:2 [Funneliformis mosseae]
MILRNNFYKTLRDLETRIKELEQSYDGLRSQFKYLEEKVGEREEETKANINNFEEKNREREEDTETNINHAEEKNSEEAKAKQEIINNFEEKIREHDHQNSGNSDKIMSTKRKRVNITAAQKRELCEKKEKDPNISNTKLAQQYDIGKSTVTDILNEKERWLAVFEGQGSVKKFCDPKWPQLKDALGLWVDNAFNTKQDINGNILKMKMKANYFARQLSIEDFNSSEQGEAGSVPSAESIERDRLILQQLLASYNPDDI